jgi:hypothetical protein
MSRLCQALVCVPSIAGPLLRLVALLGLVGASTGCSVIGLGIGTAAGASWSRWSAVDVETSPPLAGETVRAHVVTQSQRDVRVERPYVGVRYGLLVLQRPAGEDCERDDLRDEAPTSDLANECVIPLRSLRELRVPNGSYWKRGMGIGAAIGGAIDLTVIVLLGSMSKHITL